MSAELALFGGPKTVSEPVDSLFKWPIVTSEDEQAMLEMLRHNVRHLPVLRQGAPVGVVAFS